MIRPGSGARRKRRSETRRRLAAIDIGTNSLRLVVAEPRLHGAFLVVGRDREAVRLGTGRTDMKYLGRAAMERAIRTLERFKLTAQLHNAEIRAVATSAVREAINREEFLRRVRERLGIDIEVISGFEEARLIYLGVLQALPVYAKRTLVVDVGGGSTELILGRRGNAEYVNSLKIGAIRLSQAFFPDGIVRRKKVEACREFLAGALYPVRRELREAHPEAVVGTSGTFQNICGMLLASKGKEIPFLMNNIPVARAELEEIVEELLRRRTPEERARIPGLDPARADIIVAGALILEQIYRQARIDRIVYSGYALREGVLFDALRKPAGSRALSDIRRRSVMHLLSLYGVDRGHAHQVRGLATMLFDQTAPLHGLGGEHREFLEAAALLHDAGYHISHAQHHRHTYYLIRNAEALGFTDREIDIIANTARYHRKSHPKPKHENFAHLGAEDRETVRKLAAILRIADGLDRTYKNVVARVECRRRGRACALHVHAHPRRDPALELWGAERRKELFEEVFGVSVRFILHAS